MGFYKKYIIASVVGFLLSAPCVYAQSFDNQWHETKMVAGSLKAVTSQTDIEVFSSSSLIMVRVNKEVDIRIFTILGKLISSQHLSPGVYEYHMEPHGIYIVKTEDTSCKLAI